MPDVTSGHTTAQSGRRRNATGTAGNYIFIFYASNRSVDNLADFRLNLTDFVIGIGIDFDICP